jgi:hypothetical protein
MQLNQGAKKGMGCHTFLSRVFFGYFLCGNDKESDNNVLQSILGSSF